MGIGSLTTAALTLGAEFDLRNVLEGKWPSSSVSIALAAILLYGSRQRQHLQARKGLFRSIASARARLPVFICVPQNGRKGGSAVVLGSAYSSYSI